PWPRRGKRRQRQSRRTRDARALDQRGELRPRNIRMHLIAGARGAEAAVGPGDDALAPDHVGETFDALRHQLRMLDQMHAVRDHAWDQELVVGQCDLAPERPFVFVAWVRRLDDTSAGVDLQQQVDEMPELEIVHARRDVDAVAGVEADAVRRDAAQYVVERLDPQRDELAA